MAVPYGCVLSVANDDPTGSKFERNLPSPVLDRECLLALAILPNILTMALQPPRMLSTDIDDEELDGIEGANLVHRGLEWIHGRISQQLKHSLPRISESGSFIVKISHNIWSPEIGVIHIRQAQQICPTIGNSHGTRDDTKH